MPNLTCRSVGQRHRNNCLRQDNVSLPMTRLSQDELMQGNIRKLTENLFFLQLVALRWELGCFIQKYISICAYFYVMKKIKSWTRKPQDYFESLNLNMVSKCLPKVQNSTRNVVTGSSVENLVLWTSCLLT